MNEEGRKKLQTELNKHFPSDKVKSRSAGANRPELLYLSIDTILNRLNELFPLSYDWVVKKVDIVGDSCIVIGTLSIKVDDGTTVQRDGVGGDKISGDIDKSIKTAMAEAIKKACHSLGIGLYLWEKEEINKLKAEAKSNASSKDSKDNDAPIKFSEAQHKAFKLVTTQFKFKDNAEIIKELKDYTPPIKSMGDIKPTNIDKVITYLNDRLKKSIIPGKSVEA